MRVEAKGCAGDRDGTRDAPGSPEYAMRRWGLRTLILSSSIFIFTMDLADVVSEETMT